MKRPTGMTDTEFAFYAGLGRVPPADRIVPEAVAKARQQGTTEAVDRFRRELGLPPVRKSDHE